MSGVAQRPEPRTVSVRIAKGPYEGWEATARADFPARILFEFQSGELPRILAALDAIVTDHNLPGMDGQKAPAFADVDPKEGAVELAGVILEAIGNVPNR